MTEKLVQRAGGRLREQAQARETPVLRQGRLRSVEGEGLGGLTTVRKDGSVGDVPLHQDADRAEVCEPWLELA